SGWFRRFGKDRQGRSGVGIVLGGIVGSAAATGLDHVRDQADQFERANSEVRHVELPPALAVGSAARLGVVVVVPALAVADDPDQPVVAAVVMGVEIAIAPQ